MKAREQDSLLQALQARFEKHMPRHQGVAWGQVQTRLARNTRALHTLGEFDLKTSSWVMTPPDIRTLGGALFCDRRYGQVFTHHIGAQSYYAARGFSRHAAGLTSRAGTG